MDEKSSLEQTIDRRQMFLTIGCARYPYSKVKELFGDKQALNLEELSKIPIADDEKVQAIQEAEFFSPPLARLLALRFAKATYDELKHLLQPDEKSLCEKALAIYPDILTGALTWEDFSTVSKDISSLLQDLHYTGQQMEYRSDQFKRAAVLETMLCLGRASAKTAMSEASSIQRDVFGEERGTGQLNEMLAISHNHYMA